ncbi:MAG: DUF362 domain-containing protein [Candidatus Sumerlaeaceae bacterium]|nr:DUF362 domain-containing protein [Candidatus Sumerlaeaceae bacterium]
MDKLTLGSLLDTKICAIVETTPSYPAKPPFHPSELYPEYPYRSSSAIATDGPNHVYRGIRELFVCLGLDSERYGTAQWNPLGTFILPGDTVLLKPNWVRNFHEFGIACESLITHGSILRAVIDFVQLALQGKGRVIIADSPQNDAVFDEILRLSGVPEITDFYRQHSSVPVEIYDLRIEYVHKVDGVLVRHDKLPGDPLGYAAVDLGTDSLFEPVSHKAAKFRGAEYSLSEMYQHHRPGKHEYPICRTVLSADVVINLPKLKTHKKAGVTLSLKNMIGINGNKNWLPHHTEGVPSEGGDQFDSDTTKNKLEHKLVKTFKDYFPLLGPARQIMAKPIKALGKALFGDTNAGRIRSGNWWGNDTIWRTCLDLKRILLYADKEGRMTEQIQRRYLTIIDGVIAGEGNGPLAPTDKRCGLLIASHNPVVADAVATHVMGFDWRLVPIIRNAFTSSLRWPLTHVKPDEIRCVSNTPTWDGCFGAIPWDRFMFEPHFGWLGHIRYGDPLEMAPVAQ